MSAQGKVITGIVLFLALAIALALFLDVGGLRRACTSAPDQRSYDTGMALFGRANEAFSRGNYSVANDSLDLALLSLADGSAVDDDAILLAAKNEVARSNFQLAARMKRDVLNARLSQYRKKADFTRHCRAVLKRLIQ
ncbi:MAG TPA: hypothetical protein VEM35_01715 [Rhizomicrobium sp.]|nr:hypothetical protein [Rhizomicrobium sp.]